MTTNQSSYRPQTQTQRRPAATTAGKMLESANTQSQGSLNTLTPLTQGKKRTYIAPQSESSRQPTGHNVGSSHRLKEISERERASQLQNLRRLNTLKTSSAAAYDEVMVKSDIPLEEIVGGELIGLEEKYRTQFLYDPKCDKYMQLKHYKTILDQAVTLKQQRELYEKANHLTNPTKQALQYYKEAIPLNKIIEYLKTDAEFDLQKTSEPADQIEYIVTRKKNHAGAGQQSATKLSTFDLREIIYKANGYDTKKEPKINEKEIRDMLQRKDIDFETKKKYYDWLDIIEDIKLKAKKNNDVMLARAEEKEIKRAETNSHLAYHYQKLKKHLPPEVYEKHMRELNIQNDMIDKIKYKKQPKQNNLINQIEQQLQVQTEDNRLFTMYNRATHARRNHVFTTEAEDPAAAANGQQGEKRKEGYHSHMRRLKQIKSEQKMYPQKRQVSLGGYLVEQIPNINEQVNKKLNNYEKYPKLSFEEMVEQNMRKLQDMEHKNKHGDLSTKEQTQQYANEFKERVKKREQLKQNIDKYIQENQKKLEEFWEYEKQASLKRNDKDQCFREYVKQRRDEILM